jgi:excisionase family DNA binding protein
MTETERKRPYTPETLAERWGCSPELIKRMLKSGELQGFKLGARLWRIRHEAVEEFEARQDNQIDAERGS